MPRTKIGPPEEAVYPGEISIARPGKMSIASPGEQCVAAGDRGADTTPNKSSAGFATRS